MKHQIFHYRGTLQSEPITVSAYIKACIKPYSIFHSAYMEDRNDEHQTKSLSLNHKRLGSHLIQLLSAGVRLRQSRC